MTTDVAAACKFARVDVGVDPHRGPLSPRDVGRGILAAHRNARRLFRDALLLLENGRYTGAVSMAILAHEEAAKPLTLGMIGAEPLPPHLTSDSEWSRARILKMLWRDFEDHSRKNADSIRLLARRTPETTAEERDQDEELAESFVRIRERCTYVDCVQGPERWSMPDLVLDESDGVLFLGLVRRRIGTIPTAAGLARAQADNQWSAAWGPPECIKALREWSETPEAQELSDTDLAETTQWVEEVDAVLTRLDRDGVLAAASAPNETGVEDPSRVQD